MSAEHEQKHERELWEYQRSWEDKLCSFFAFWKQKTIGGIEKCWKISYHLTKKCWIYSQKPFQINRNNKMDRIRYKTNTVQEKEDFNNENQFKKISQLGSIKILPELFVLLTYWLSIQLLIDNCLSRVISLAENSW